MSETAVYLDAIGVVTPGVVGWDAFCAALQENGWQASEDWQIIPACLSARQAKRLSETTRLALACAEQIGDALTPDAGWVFASSLGEGLTLDVILNALSEDEILISPMKFQNAVHNAAVGQWTIAGNMTGPSTSIAAFDDTAGAGMLKTWLQCTQERIPVGMVAYDWPLPEPLHAKRAMTAPLAIAIAVSPAPTSRSIRRLLCTLERQGLSECSSAIGCALMDSRNPIVALIPLLECVASGNEGSVSLGLSGGSTLAIEVSMP